MDCNGSYTMMAKPMKNLELHYPIIQILIIHDIMRKPNSIIVLLDIFHTIHPQKKK